MNSSVWISIWCVSAVLLIGFGSAFVLQMFLRGLEKRLQRSSTNADRLKRLTTLVHAGRSIGRVLILLIV
jgi:hypothetical protein